jgi:hypothetical protein
MYLNVEVDINQFTVPFLLPEIYGETSSTPFDTHHMPDNLTFFYRRVGTF